MEYLGIFLILGLASRASALDSPHVIFIVGDDIGWNDVSWNNPDIFTPNLKDLAENGVILNSSYVQPICTPTRSSFLTGRYPMRYGLQRGVIQKDRHQYLTTNYTLLPEKLKTGGYSTHMFGKWHLGYCDWSYTPNRRGFDNFGGIYLGSSDHYQYTTGAGFDFRINETVNSSFVGTHSTETYTKLAVDVIKNHDPDTPLFLYLAYQAAHTPLQADSQYLDQYSHVSDDARRKFSAMVTQMDDSIGRVRTALEDKNMMDNLVLIFITDNGGASNVGNNYPLKGAKGTLWEGGVRTPALVYSKTHLEKTNYTQSGMMHVVDWYSTILHVAGVTPDSGVDGRNQWDMISKDSASSRTEFLYNVDEDIGRGAAIRDGPYKLIEGSPGKPNTAIPPASRKKRDLADEYEYNVEEDEEDHLRVKRATKYRLYNIDDDPNETTDISNANSNIVDALKAKLAVYRSEVYPVIDSAPDDASKPKNFGGNWSPGWCTGGL